MIKHAIIFLAGIGVGALAMHTYMKDKVQKAMDEMSAENKVVEDVKEEAKEESKDEQSDDMKAYKSYSSLTEEYKAPEKVAYYQVTKNAEPDDEKDIPGDLMDQFPHEKDIEIIDSDDYDSNAEIFTSVGCVYYVQNKALVQDEFDLDDGQTPELQIDESIGLEAEQMILDEYLDRDVIFVRNYRTSTQYEVVIEDDYYMG